MDVLNELSLSKQYLFDCFETGYEIKSSLNLWEPSTVQQASTIWPVAMLGCSTKDGLSRTGFPNESHVNEAICKQDPRYHSNSKKMGVSHTSPPLSCHPLHMNERFGGELTPSTNNGLKKELECSLGDSSLDWVVYPNGWPFLMDHSVKVNPGHMYVSNDGDMIAKDQQLDRNSSAKQSKWDDKLSYLHGDGSSKQSLAESELAYACAKSPMNVSACGSLSSSVKTTSNHVSSSSDILHPVVFDQSYFLEYATHGLKTWFDDPFPNGGALQTYPNDGNFINYVKKEEPMANDGEEHPSCRYNGSEAAHSQQCLASSERQQGSTSMLLALNEGMEAVDQLRNDFEDNFVKLHKVAQDGSALSNCTQFCPPKPFFGALDSNDTMHVTNDGGGAAENEPLTNYADGSRQLNSMFDVDTNMKAFECYGSEGNKAAQKQPKPEEDVCKAREWGSRSASDLFLKFDVRMTNEYTELGLIQLLTASAEAVARRDMNSASVILVRLKDMVSSLSNTMLRVVSYFIQGLEHQIEGAKKVDHASSIMLQGDILAAFQILHEIFPYIKFGHFTANQAILEAVQGAKHVQIVDFEIMEGIQWPAFMQALVTRKGGPPELRITALCRPHWEHGLAMVQKTGKRLSEFAVTLGLPFSFGLLKTDHDEIFDAAKLKCIEGEVLVVNCMIHLPHMPRRSMASVASFLQGMCELSPGIVTLVEEELGCNTSAVASYFSEALFHFHAICDSLEACLPTDVRARMLVEKVFMAPRIESAVAMWSWAMPSRSVYRMDVNDGYKWSTVMHSTGFKPAQFSYHSHSQAKLLLGLHRDGFCFEERSHYLVLGWQSRPLFAASVWS